MGGLTESMTRLRNEILVMRRSRLRLRMELAQSAKSVQVGVSGLRAAIASDLAGARRAWSGSAAGTGIAPAPAAKTLSREYKKRKRR